MSDDDTYRSRLQTTIAALRYWVPAVSDAARVEESERGGSWQLSVRPLYRGACPFSLTLSRNGTYCLTVDGITHSGLALESFDIFLPLVEAISEGRVRHRRSVSANTGITTAVETMIDLGNGHAWVVSAPLPMEEAGAPTGDCIQLDQHFLPYRRR